MKCPTEIAITDRREAELAKNGFMPLSHCKNTDYAVFIGAQSLQKPAEYDDPDATANANLAARLPYLFATCRFAHYLKCIVRDKIGSFKERADMETWLNNWIIQYVDGDPANASEDDKARRPLAAAEVVVEEVEGNPGYYTSKFFLRPHYQLEGLTVSLRLVSKLPSVKSEVVIRVRGHWRGARVPRPAAKQKRGRPPSAAPGYEGDLPWHTMRSYRLTASRATAPTTSTRIGSRCSPTIRALPKPPARRTAPRARTRAAGQTSRTSS